MARKNLLFTLPVTLVAGALMVVGCGAGADSNETEIDNGFESDDPTGQSAANRGEGSSSGGADAGSVGASAPEDTGGADAQRAVEEADIIKLDGKRLYALSRYGGLAVVDVTDPDHMKMLGRKRTDGIPFEMYVENGRAHIMLNDFGRYVRDETSGPYGRWIQSSELLTLDVQNPAAITEASHYDVPGSISDSRMVGTALYLVTQESGYCWNCQTVPATVVTSFSVGSAIAKVDQLVYSSQQASYSAWKRSVSATNQRLYVAGPEWSWQPGAQIANSIIQVIDITDPGGKLTKGADIVVAGQINSRWQMDEFQGVLRVVSQFGNGWGGPSGQINPKVQTFTVASSSNITPLGQTELKLPKPEQLRSVRFDGIRGYAITSERTDPLFTIDLSNPAAPRQAAALEMPGWIFHMEPRGDRLVGFGYDGTTGAASLAVSLFDVTNLASPTMLKRVSFGSGWGQLAEDQDRIHKSVRVLDENGLILVPFASYGRWGNGNCEKGQSGIQLIDFSRDNLTLRGLAPQYGLPRRALIAGERLLAVSDRNVTSFDIGSRDAPRKTSELDLSNPAYRLAELPNHIASITSDWWSGEALLSVTPKANADDAAVSGKLSLASLAEPNESYCSGRNAWTSWYEARLFPNGNTVYLTVPVYTYAAKSQGGRLIVAAIDVSDPADPKLVGRAESPFRERGNTGYYGGVAFWDGWSLHSYYGGISSSLVGSGQAVVQHGTKLAYIEVSHEPIRVEVGGATRYDSKVHRRIHVIDFAAPAAPKVHTPIELAESFGSSPLHLFKGTVLTSRWVRSNKNPDKVRFFVDRIDLDGDAPVHLASVNTPGSILLADEASSRFATVDYSAERFPNSDSQSCYERVGGRGRFDYQSKDCVVVTRAFKLADVSGTKVTLRQTMNPPNQNFSGVTIADDRIYVTRQKRYDYRGVTQANQLPKVLEDGGLWAIGGIREGKLEVVSEMVGDTVWPLAAFGSKVALYTDGGLAIYDTATRQPKLIREASLRGWGYSSHVLLGTGRAICSLGEWGLQTIDY